METSSGLFSGLFILITFCSYFLEVQAYTDDCTLTVPCDTRERQDNLPHQSGSAEHRVLVQTVASYPRTRSTSNTRLADLSKA